MEIKEMNIYQKISAITTEMKVVAKNLSVSSGSFSYKAVAEGDVLAEVKKLEAKYGICSYPESRQVIANEIIESESNGKKTTKVFMRIEATYVFVNIDKPTERISVMSYGDGIDTQDKAPGKAMTYCDKYALMKVYKIETGDDPDQQGSEETSFTKKEMSTNVNPISLETHKKLVSLNITDDYVIEWCKSKNNTNYEAVALKFIERKEAQQRVSHENENWGGDKD